MQDDSTIVQKDSSLPWPRFLWLFIALNVLSTAYHIWNVAVYKEYDPTTLPGLRPGYIPGFQYQDLSDLQWSAWREGLLMLTAGLGIFVLASNIVKRLNMNRKASERVKIQVLFYNAAGFVFVAAMFGFCGIYIYLALTLCFLVTKVGEDHHKISVAFVWIFNIAMLFVLDRYHGIYFADLSGYLSFLDSFRGILRWEVYYRMCVVRIISYTMDYFWALKNLRSPQEQSISKSKTEYAKRQDTDRPMKQYTLVNCLAYVLYPPFLVAGPITTFNAWISHVYRPQTQLSTKQIAGLFFSSVFWMAFIELWLHVSYNYAVHINGMWSTVPSSSFLISGLLVLLFMGAKFLSIWRYFRAFGFMDGFESPDNMTRCAINNCTVTGFWRNWHGSMNKWILRYMYIPLGGTKYQHFSIWLIFGFIALWHDIDWRWICWAILNCFFMTFEKVTVAIFSKYKSLRWTQEETWQGRVFRTSFACFTSMAVALSNLAIIHSFNGIFPNIYHLIFSNGGQTFFWGYVFINIIDQTQFDYRMILRYRGDKTAGAFN
eukprot:TRINITY_DN6446_c0_g1_i1.p1 TRINITY_DN6446_c0_g1~~TRINITY_DN6446_c0_g1_i1.p1  ORF type:complete len:544 (+),score=138.25 TRINITY_DN6446_c0_g1_i1:42-1673(+)